MVPDEYSPGQFLPGTVYRVVRSLGRGAAGGAYEVEDSTLGKRYALKTIADPRVDVRSLADRLMRESQILAKVADSRVVGVYTGGVSTDGHCFYVMEMLDGEPLGTSLRQSGKLDLDAVLSVGIEIGEALASLHGAGFVHRDVKPDNIFVSSGGPGGTSAKLLLDPAVANAMEGPGPKAGSIYGSFGYASPEQLRGEPAAASMDIWSLGCVLYHAISGRLPFEVSSDWRTYVDGVLGASPAPHLTDVSPQAPADLVALLARMLRKEPSRRLPQAEMVSATLRRIGVRQSTRPPSAPVDPDPADQTLPGTTTAQQNPVDPARTAPAKVAEAPLRSPRIVSVAPAEEAEETATLRVRPQQITIQDLVDPTDVTPVLLKLAPAESADETATLRVFPQPVAPPAAAIAADQAPVEHQAAPGDDDHAAETLSVRAPATAPAIAAGAADPDLTPVRLHSADDVDETETRRMASGQTAPASPSDAVDPDLTPVRWHAADDVDESEMRRLPAAQTTPRDPGDVADVEPVRGHAPPGGDDDDEETLLLLSTDVPPPSSANALASREERPYRRRFTPHDARLEALESRRELAASSPSEDSDAELTIHEPMVFDEAAESPEEQGTIPEQPAIVSAASPLARAIRREPVARTNVVAALEDPTDPEYRAPIPVGPDTAGARTDDAHVAAGRAVDRVAQEPPHSTRLFAAASAPQDPLSPEHRLALSPHIAGPISRPPMPAASDRPRQAPERNPFQSRVTRTPERNPFQSRVSTAPERNPFESPVSPAQERSPFQRHVSTRPERNPVQNRLSTVPERNPFQTFSQPTHERPSPQRFEDPTAKRSQGLATYGEPAPDRPPRPTFYSLPARAPRLTYALLFFSVLIAWMTVGLVFLHFVGVRKRSHFQ